MGGARPAPEASANGSSDEGENVVGSSDETVTKRPRAAGTKRSRARPDEHEGPLCPSGHFFSKPVRDPSVSPSAPKRAKLASPARVEVALLPVSSGSSASEREGKGRGDGKGGDKRSRSPNSGDQQEGAKSQILTSPGEVAKAVQAASSGLSVLKAEEDVGPARVPTEVENALLASMSRRSYNVPLRLDARER